MNDFVTRLNEGGDVTALSCSSALLEIFDADTSGERDDIADIQRQLCSGGAADVNDGLTNVAEIFKYDELREKVRISCATPPPFPAHHTYALAENRMLKYLKQKLQKHLNFAQSKSS